jgi:hypothetical protein
MQAINSPTKMPVPFADSGTKNAIPIPSQIGVTPGLASFTTGFPPLTFTPIAAGGVPPFGADFNGVLNAITQALRWTNAGGQYIYDAAFATSIGGYPKGALLQRSTLDGFWLCTADNNSTDPDAGGAGWIDPMTGRLINIQTFSSSGTYTPTAGTKSVVVEVQGGGGGGGACYATGAGQYSIGSPGAGGGYAKSRLTAGFAGVTVTVGAGGTGGTAGTDNATSGGTSSFGALLSATGGAAGSAAAATTQSIIVNGKSVAGIGAGGNIANIGGGNPSPTVAISTTAISTVASGGAVLGGSIGSRASSGPGGNNVGFGYGGGGGGAIVLSSAAAAKGGDGAGGVVIVWEYA